MVVSNNLPVKAVTSFSKTLRTLFSVSANDPELAVAQFHALSRQVPLLYFLLIVSSLAVSYTFSHLAPLWLSVWLPGTLCLIAGVRGIHWWRKRRQNVTPDFAIAQLRRTTKMAAFLAIGFMSWGLSLHPYGDDHAQGHVIFYMGITVVGCIFCLMHLRSAAILVTLIVNVPFILFFGLWGDQTEKAIAVNIVLVSAAILTILMTHYRDFADLVRSRRDLMTKQAETQALSDENFRIANLDALTELPNRRRFFHDLEQAFAEAKAGRQALSVGVLDLDGFKPINDTYGHATGDRVLSETARRLEKACLGFIDAKADIYRLGGDEFGLIVRDAMSDEALSEVGRHLTDVVRLPFTIGSTHAHMACSIGMATWSETIQSAEILFENADYALYYAKRNLRGQTVLFSDKHAAEIRTQTQIERHLLSADLEQELIQLFQPIVDLKSGRVLSFEALARWYSPQLGLVAPDVFIPVAERAGLIGGVTRVLLEKALREMRNWPEDIGLSFNLSAHDICAAEGVVRLVAIVNASGIDPRRIDFEITETAMAHDFVKARQSMQMLKTLGCHLSLDDFGTGYSSLSYVHRLPLDRIKVDRSFVTDIENDCASKVVRSMTGLCADMGLKSIIEGVETAEQLDRLQAMGCDMAQGYLFAKPMHPSMISGYLADTNRIKASPAV